MKIKWNYNDDEIRPIAYQIWEAKGKPDGEEIVDKFPYGRIKVKEWHWFKAIRIKQAEDIKFYITQVDNDISNVIGLTATDIGYI